MQEVSGDARKNGVSETASNRGAGARQEDAGAGA